MMRCVALSAAKWKQIRQPLRLHQNSLQKNMMIIFMVAAKPKILSSKGQTIWFGSKGRPHEVCEKDPMRQLAVTRSNNHKPSTKKSYNNNNQSFFFYYHHEIYIFFRETFRYEINDVLVYCQAFGIRSMSSSSSSCLSSNMNTIFSEKYDSTA